MPHLNKGGSQQSPMPAARGSRIRRRTNVSSRSEFAAQQRCSASIAEATIPVLLLSNPGSMRAADQAVSGSRSGRGSGRLAEPSPTPAETPRERPIHGSVPRPRAGDLKERHNPPRARSERAPRLSGARTPDQPRTSGAGHTITASRGRAWGRTGPVTARYGCARRCDRSHEPVGPVQQGRQHQADTKRRRARPPAPLAEDPGPSRRQAEGKAVGARLVEAAEAWGRAAGATIAETTTYHGSPLSVSFWGEHMSYEELSVNLRKALLPQPARQRRRRPHGAPELRAR